MRYKIIKEESQYKILSTDEDKYGLFDSVEEAEAAIDIIVGASVYSGDGDKLHVDSAAKLMEEMRAENNNKAKRSYRLGRR